VYDHAFHNPHQESHRDFFLMGRMRRFRQLPKGEIGNVVWDAGFVMSKYLEDHYGKKLRDKNVIELGSGTGIVGITAALQGAKVILTDKNDPVLDLLSANVESIFVDDSSNIPSVRKLEWGNNSQVELLAESGPFDYILCSDVIYAPDCFAPLLDTLRLLCTSNITTILLAYKKRYDREEQFFSSASPYFHFFLEPGELVHPDFQSADIYIYKVQRIV